MAEKESVDRICGQIREDGAREIDSILAKARSTADEILAKAEAEGKAVAERILGEARDKGEIARRRLLSSVNLEVKRVRLRAREEVVETVMREAKAGITRAREREDYRTILTGLVAEAIETLPGEEFIVIADRRDLDAIEGTVFPEIRDRMKRQGRSVRALAAKALEEPSLGGARVAVPGGSVIFDNTFEARLYRLRDEVRALILTEVFSGDEGEPA